MNYVYLRVSTSKQTIENQNFEIQKWCENRNIHIDFIYQETMSGTIAPKYRRLGTILKKAKKGDSIIVSEISRLGRSLLQIMGVLNQCMECGITIYSIKENYELGDNINSKILAFAFGLSAEIERQLISQRTKEALDRLKSNGKHIGRFKGALTPTQQLKLYPFKEKILGMRQQGIPILHIARELKVNRKTITYFLSRLKSQSEV